MDIEKCAAQEYEISHELPNLPGGVNLDRPPSSGGSAGSDHDLDEKRISVDDLASIHVIGPAILPAQVTHDEGEFIEGGWLGWSVVAGCFLIGAPTVGEHDFSTHSAVPNDETISIGWNLSWGVFQAYHSAHLLRTIPDATISVIGAIQNTMMAIVAFVAGKLGDRFGYKVWASLHSFWLHNRLYWTTFVFMVQAVLVNIADTGESCVLSWDGADQDSQGVLQGIGCGLTLPMVFAIPSQWFKKRRGLATGIVIAGAALGGAVSSLIVPAMLTHLRLHKTLLIYSFVQGVIMLIGCLLIKTRFPSSRAETSRKIQWVNLTYLKDPTFWSFWSALALFVLGYMNPFIFISVYTREKLPHHSQQLTNLPISIMNFSSAIGRTTVGLAADKIGFLNAFILTSTISAFSQVVLWNLTTESYAGVIVFSIIFGLTGPCYVSLTTPVAATLYGTQNLATLTGLLNLASLPGALSGPPLGGLILGSSGRNWHVLAGYSGVVQFVGMVCVLYARFKREPRIFARL